MPDLCDVYTRARLLIRLSDNSPGSTSQPLHRVSPFESETSVCTLVPANPLYYPTVRAIQRFQLLFRETSRIVESSPPAKNDIRTIGNSRSVDRRQEWERMRKEKRIGSIAVYRERSEGKTDRRNRARSVGGTVTHSPINFAGRSIDHNVLFCSLVFLSAAFDSIRGCGESIYLPRCHAPPVMDGGCTLTLTTPKGERACAKNSPTHSLSSPSPPPFPIPISLPLSLFFIPSPSINRVCLYANTSNLPEIILRFDTRSAARFH